MFAGVGGKEAVVRTVSSAMDFQTLTYRLVIDMVTDLQTMSC